MAARCVFQLVRVPTVFACMLLLSVTLSFAQDTDALLSSLRSRADAFDRVRVEYDWLQCRADKGDDPFDPENWHLDSGSSVRYTCVMSLLRPNLRFESSSRLPGESDTVRTWIDGKRSVRSWQDDNIWGVYVDDNRWAIHGPIPYLTPFEMQLCDVQHSLLEMVEAGGLTIDRWTDQEVILEGTPASPPRTPTGTSAPSSIRAAASSRSN